MIRYWKEYAQKERVDWYDLSLSNCLNYIEFVRDKLKQTFSSVVRSRNFVTSLRHFTGKPFTESDKYLLDRYALASFNTNPPKAKRPVVTWDINVLLDHLVQMGQNMEIKKINHLGGKLALLLLITQACRLGEVSQLQLSTLQLIEGGVQFYLNNPTKTFGPGTYKQTSRLQLMSVKEFPENPLLCPVDTLLAYMKRTHIWRQQVDNLFVVVTTQEWRAAHQATISRWAKTVMQDAGLGQFCVKSSRSAASTSALLMGLPLDTVISKVGWLRSSTFTRFYLCPINNASAPGLPHNPGSTPDIVSSPAKKRKINKISSNNRPTGIITIFRLFSVTRHPVLTTLTGLTIWLINSGNHINLCMPPLHSPWPKAQLQFQKIPFLLQTQV